MPHGKQGGRRDPAAVRACLRRLLQGDDFQVARVASGVSTPVYRVVKGGATLYLRLAEGPESDLRPEMHVHRLLSLRGAHVPQVLVYETRAPEVAASIALLSEIRGEPLGPDPKLPDGALERVMRMAGEELAMVNQIGVDGFGWIRRDLACGRLAGEHGTFGEWLFSGGEEDVEGCLATLRSLGSLRVTGEVPGPVMRLATDPSLTAALAHGDFDLTHIFHVDGRYSGMIDFGEIRGAEPWYDLAGFFRLGESPPSPVRRRCYEWLRAAWNQGSQVDAELTARVSTTAWLVALRFAARHLARAGPSGRDLPWVRDAVTFVQEAWPRA